MYSSSYSFRLKTENGENAWLYFCSLKYFYLNLRNTKNINHNDGFSMLPAAILTTCCLLQPLDYVLFYNDCRFGIRERSVMK